MLRRVWPPSGCRGPEQWCMLGHVPDLTAVHRLCALRVPAAVSLQAAAWKACCCLIQAPRLGSRQQQCCRRAGAAAAAGACPQGVIEPICSRAALSMYSTGCQGNKCRLLQPLLSLIATAKLLSCSR